LRTYQNISNGFFILAKEPVRGSQEEQVVLHRTHIATLTVSALHRSDLDSESKTIEDDESKDSLSVIEHIDEQIPSYRLKDNGEIYNESIDCSKVFILFSTPTVLLIYMQGIPGCVPWGMIYVYLNDYLSANRGIGR